MNKKNADKVWFFRWTRGGYNTVIAPDKHTARLRADVLGRSCKLECNLKTLCLATDAMIAKEETRYSGMFD